MAGRSSTTFQKRQKELARQDKQKEKAAKRLERKQVRSVPGRAIWTTISITVWYTSRMRICTNREQNPDFEEKQPD